MLKVSKSHVEILAQDITDSGNELGADAVVLAAAYIDLVINSIHGNLPFLLKGDKINVHPLKLDGRCYHPDCQEDLYNNSCYCSYHFSLFHRDGNKEFGLCDVCHARTGKRKGNIVKCNSCDGDWWLLHRKGDVFSYIRSVM